MNKTIAIDTNILLDYFYERQEGYDAAQTIFEKSSRGELTIILFLPVILEYEWVSRTIYKRNKNEIIATIRALIHLPGIEIELVEKDIVSQALILYQNQTSVNFDDCLIVLMAKQRKIKEFMTRDVKLKKLYTKL